MKKNKILFIATLSATCLFSLASCQGAQGPKGDQGTPGINGTNGTNGQDGKNGYSVLTGKGEPASTLGSDGDSYIDTDTFDFYSKSSGSWSKIGNIKGLTGEQGETGDKGETGEKGQSLLTGSGVPSSELGSDGDSYIDLDTFDFYSKSSGSWTKYGNIKGADGSKGDAGDAGEDGKKGSSVLTGKGEPASTLGSDGDSYIDTSSFDFYTKSNGVWSKVGNIKGEKGDQGEKGDKGNSGWSGSKGDKGDTAWANTILPCDYGYVVPSVGSAVLDQKISFKMYPLNTLEKRYTCTSLELISSDSSMSKKYITKDFKVDTNETSSMVYLDEVPMVAGGYVVKAEFEEDKKQNINISTDSSRVEITSEPSTSTKAYVGEKVTFTITPQNNSKITSLSVTKGEKAAETVLVSSLQETEGVYTYSTFMEYGGLTVSANYDIYSALNVSKTGNGDVKVYQDDKEVDSNNYVFKSGSKVTLKIKPVNYFKSLTVDSTPSSDWTYDFKENTYSKEITIGESDISASVEFSSSKDDQVTREISLYNKEDLKAFRDKINKNPDLFTNSTIKLANDINLGGEEWVPISGKLYDYNITFDGNEKTISNFKVTEKYTFTDGDDVKDGSGFFGNVYGITIKDLYIDNATISGIHWIGGIVGYGYDVNITGCKVTNSKLSAKVSPKSEGSSDYDYGDKVGGIVGFLYRASSERTANVSECEVSNLTLKGFRDVGSLVGISGIDGTASAPTVKDNKITGNITLINDYSNVYEDYKTFTYFDNYIGRNEKGTDVSSNKIENGVSVTKTIEICDGLTGKYVDGHLEYYISSAVGLNTLRDYVNSNYITGDDNNKPIFKIMNDIVLDSNEVWTPMNLNYGIFDGNGKWISNLNVKGTQNVGFIGYGQSSVIQNVYIKNSVVRGAERVGGVIGNICSCVVTNCKVENTDIIGIWNKNDKDDEGPSKLGAIIGDYDFDGAEKTIENLSASNCNIYGSRCVGGLIGRIRRAKYHVKNLTGYNINVYKVYDKTDNSKYNEEQFGQYVGLFNDDCITGSTIDSQSISMKNVNILNYREKFGEDYIPSNPKK